MEDTGIIGGAASLTGRIPSRPPVEPEEGEAVLHQPSGAMPGNCRRVMHSPGAADRNGGGCSTCQGRQRDGSCLVDIVRAAIDAGVDWRFDVGSDGVWDYAGAAIPGYEQTRGDEVGAVEGRWAEGHGPAAPYATGPSEPPSFECPHCHAHVVQDPANFHFWCPECGRNANDE